MYFTLTWPTFRDKEKFRIVDTFSNRAKIPHEAGRRPLFLLAKPLTGVPIIEPSWNSPKTLHNERKPRTKPGIVTPRTELANESSHIMMKMTSGRGFHLDTIIICHWEFFLFWTRGLVLSHMLLLRMFVFFRGSGGLIKQEVVELASPSYQLLLRCVSRFIVQRHFGLLS